MNLGFNEPKIGVLFALGFDKPIELHRGLPKMNLRFCEPVKLTKKGPFDKPGVCSSRVRLLHACHS